MPKLSRTHLTVAAATAAAFVGGSAIAGAAGTSTTPSASSTATQPSAKDRGGRGAGETALTGETKTKVEAAALAKVPGGTVLRSETDNGGVYEAHVRKADGTEVEVKVDKDFTVTAVNAFSGRGGGHGGPGGGHGRFDLSAVATKLGVSEEKLQSAVDAARPDDARKDRGADRAADLAKALNVETAKVQSILDANRPSRDSGDRGPRGGGPGGPGGPGAEDTALVSALAKGLNKSEADVKAALAKLQAAHQAEREQGMSDLYAAVAKALGKDAADVKAAFEAARPTR